MRKVWLPTIVLIFLVIGGLYTKMKLYPHKHNLENTAQQVSNLTKGNTIKEGDIIFQTSLSGQSRAIQLATHSEYSHCGLIYKNDTGYFVYEAVQPVKLTPLNKWIAKGKDGRFVIKRLKNAKQIMTPETLKKMKQVGNNFRGKNYDIYFDWSDDKIYCSELIWKIYQRATGIEIGKLEKLRDFDLTDEVVKQKMKERYGNNMPLNETVISPTAIFKSELLTTVATN